MKIRIVLLCLFIVFYGCSHPENSEKNSKVKTILNSEKDSSSFAEVADKEVHNNTTLPKKESMNATKNNEWSTFKSEAYNFSVNYPKNWLIGETDLGVGTGPEEVGEIVWSISVYDNQTQMSKLSLIT